MISSSQKIMKKEDPGRKTFSLIVPIYKIEQFLPKCVDSILSQTYSNFELILVDDGSPDNCPFICDEYAKKDTRIKVIHKKNGGTASARQAGVALATGEYIACVDGDDWIASDYLQKFSEAILKFDADVVCCGMTFTYKKRSIKCPIPLKLGYYDRLRIEEEIFPILIERRDGVSFTNTLCATVIRKEIYCKKQFVDPLVNIGEDIASMKPCIYCAQSIVLLGECLYFYRRHKASVTLKPNPRKWDEPKIIAHHFKETIGSSKWDFQQQIFRNTVHRLFNVCVSQFDRNAPYSIIKKDIKEHLNDKFYAQCIKRSDFIRSWKHVLAQNALRHRWIFLMILFNRIKRFCHAIELSL